jgi:hypothetical protein
MIAEILVVLVLLLVVIWFITSRKPMLMELKGNNLDLVAKNYGFIRMRRESDKALKARMTDKLRNI